MDFTALKAELAARGFQRYTDAQLGTLINRAITELDEMARWPYREASVTGVAPLAVTDLGTVDVVFDMTGTDRRIPGAQYQVLIDTYGDLSTTGAAPSYWYLAYPAGVATVATFPGSAVTVGVQYYKVGPVLVSGSDVPLAPERFHGLIVDVAARKALRQKGAHEDANSLQAEVDRQVGEMREALLYQPQAGPSVLRMGCEDY